MKRPTAITVIAVLAAIGGVFGVLGGLVLLGLGSFAGSLGVPGSGVAFLTGTTLGAVILGIGVLDLVAAYGAWNLKKWAVNLLIGISAVSILLNVVTFTSGSILSLVISAVIIYFVWTNKDAFTN